MAKLIPIVTVLLLMTITITTTHAFTTIVRSASKRTSTMARTVETKIQLQAFSFYSTASGSSLVISDEINAASEQAAAVVTATITTTTDAAETAIAATAAYASSTDAPAVEAFTDQIDLFGDPTIRSLLLVAGGIVVLLAGLSVLSKKVDDAIENVVGDFETVLRTSPEFRSKWMNEIEPQLEVYDREVDRDLKRKQKLFEIMEEMQQKEPALMEKINTKMGKL